MQKIFLSVLDKIIEQRPSNSELAVLLYIARYQDDHGTVSGVHYKDVCDATGICIQSLYNALDGLENKQIIAVTSSHYGDRDITILGNEDVYAIYGEKLSKKPSYISLHHQMFMSEKFKSMKPKAKLLAMLFLIYASSNAGGYHPIKPENFFSKYCELLGVKKETLRRYLTELRRFFSIKIRNAIYLIVPEEDISRDNPFRESDDDLLIKNLAKVAFRRKPLLMKNNQLLTSKDIASHLNDFLRNQLRKPKISQCFLKAFMRIDPGKKISFPHINKLLQEELAAVN